jgi:hypothetical protein
MNISEVFRAMEAAVDSRTINLLTAPDESYVVVDLEQLFSVGTLELIS